MRRRLRLGAKIFFARHNATPEERRTANDRISKQVDRITTMVNDILEFTRLEPGVIDQKIYAPGIGIVRELSQKGPLEVARLVSVRG